MHKVTVRKGFTGPQRQRAGIAVSREYPYTGELSEEQLKAVEADPELEVTEVETGKTESKPAEDKKSEGKASTTRKMVEKPEGKKG